jgi:pimeloyl-ACP methyl ester carboxylesterase
VIAMAIGRHQKKLRWTLAIRIGILCLSCWWLAGTLPASAHERTKTELRRDLNGLDCRRTNCFLEGRKLFARYRAEVSDTAVELLSPKLGNQRSKEVLLYVHSFMEHPTQVREFADAYLKNGYHVLALSFSGFESRGGKLSGAALGSFGVEALEADLQFALDLARLYGSEIHLMGYSMGGLLATSQFVRDHRSVASLTLVAPALGANSDSLAMLISQNISCTIQGAINGGNALTFGLLERLNASPEVLQQLLELAKLLGHKNLPPTERILSYNGLYGILASVCLMVRLREKLFAPNQIYKQNPGLQFAGFSRRPLLMILSGNESFVSNPRAREFYASWGRESRAPEKLAFFLSKDDPVIHEDILTRWKIDLPRLQDSFTVRDNLRWMALTRGWAGPLNSASDLDWMNDYYKRLE